MFVLVCFVCFVVSFLESRNHETHKTHEKEHEKKWPEKSDPGFISLIRPIRVQKNVCV